MATVEVNKSTGIVLDWLIARCKEVQTSISKTGYLIFSDKSIAIGPNGSVYQPSSIWAQGGPIIYREKIDMEFDPNGKPVVMARMRVNGRRFRAYGETPLIAAMRCFVIAKLGDKVEVPNELFNKGE